MEAVAERPDTRTNLREGQCEPTPQDPILATGYGEEPDLDTRHMLATAVATTFGSDLLACATYRLAWQTRESAIEPEDLVQQAIVLFLEERIEWRGSLRQLVRSLCAAIRNYSRDRYKSDRKIVALDDARGDPAATTGRSLADRVIAAKDVQRAIDALPPAMQAAVTGYWLDESTAEEVASDRGCAESTVRKHLARARPRLRDRLLDYGCVDDSHRDVTGEFPHPKTA
jgi:RNA polymerase sigma factor (sigma-70 family)